jgi:hypothetical protein
VQTRTWKNAGERVRACYQQVIDESKSSQETQVRQVGFLASLCTRALVRMFQLTSTFSGKHLSPAKRTPHIEVKGSLN